MIRNRWFALCAVTWLCALSGCGFTADGTLLERPFDSLVKSRVTGVDYEVTGNTFRMYAFQARLDRHLEQVFTQADPGIGRAPLHVVVSIQSVAEQEPFFREFFAAVTLFLVPSYRPMRFSLNAEARWNGAPVGSYAYEEGMKYWIGWYFLPVTFDGAYSQETVTGSIFDNMLANLVADLARDTKALP